MRLSLFTTVYIRARALFLSHNLRVTANGGAARHTDSFTRTAFQIAYTICTAV